MLYSRKCIYGYTSVGICTLVYVCRYKACWKKRKTSYPF